MVSRAHLRKKKVWNTDLDDHWIMNLPRGPEVAPGDTPWMICVEERCKGWTPTVVVSCVYGFCTEMYCGVCGRAGGGWGPIGCPCDGATKGHNTLAERPGARGKVIFTPATVDDLFDKATVIPFKKHKPRHRRRR